MHLTEVLLGSSSPIPLLVRHSSSIHPSTEVGLERGSDSTFAGNWVSAELHDHLCFRVNSPDGSASGRCFSASSHMAGIHAS